LKSFNNSTLNFLKNQNKIFFYLKKYFWYCFL